MSEREQDESAVTSKAAPLEPAAEASSAPVVPAVPPRAIRAEDQPKIISSDPDLAQFLSFTRTLLVPMFLWKVCMLYFGLNYSMYPGEGYGYGLAATILASLTGFVVFMWKNRGAR